LVLGVSGILSVAQLVFYAVGGYTSALLSTDAGVNPWLTLPIGAIAAAITAVLIGIPILRMRGIYVVLLTLGMNELLRNYIQTGPEALGRGEGLRAPGLFPDLSGFAALTSYYMVALVIFVLVTASVWWLIHSPVGLAFTALRDSEVYAAGRGVDRRRTRLLLFAASAFMAGLAGAFMTQYQGLISPAVLDFSFLIILQAMIVVGGWGTFAGPILGTFVIIGLRELVQPLGAGFTQIALGVLMAGIVVVVPQGLWPAVDSFWRRMVRRAKVAIVRARRS
jgi:branched-chain amino acid transport system permease protein